MYNIKNGQPYDWVTVLALNIQTDMSEQIVSTQIRLFLEQSDQGQHYLP